MMTSSGYKFLLSRNITNSMSLRCYAFVLATVSVTFISMEVTEMPKKNTLLSLLSEPRNDVTETRTDTDERFSVDKSNKNTFEEESNIDETTIGTNEPNNTTVTADDPFHSEDKWKSKSDIDAEKTQMELLRSLSDKGKVPRNVSQSTNHSFINLTQVENYRLKGIRDIITPVLLMGLASAGQGDKIVLAASNYPAAKVARMKGVPVIEIPGTSIAQLTKEIMKLITLDTSQPTPLYILESSGQEKQSRHARLKHLLSIIRDADGRLYKFKEFGWREFQDFANDTVAIVHTGDPVLSNTLMLTKGLITPKDNKFGGRASL